MSYDLILEPKNGQKNADADLTEQVKKWLLSRANTQMYGETVIYENTETGVYFY